MKTNTEKTEKQFDLISSRHIVAVCSAAALLASSVVIQGQKEAINQTVINQKIETGYSADIRQLWKLTATADRWSQKTRYLQEEIYSANLLQDESIWSGLLSFL